MIPQPASDCQTTAWQNILSRAIRDPAELLALLELPADLLPAARRAAARFPLRVTRSYLGKMNKGDPGDPLLRQVLPLAAELEPDPAFSRDPVGDLAAMPEPGLLHKYAGRVLLVTTGACAIHCRYCFRRHFPYADANPAARDWQAALRYVAANDSVTEVILSGGDPLSLNDARLAGLATRLAAIPHVQRLRLHTRLPVVLPERVDGTLLAWLTDSPLQTVLVVHVNHGNELGPDVVMALERLRGAGVRLFNQAVLLRGINDSVTALTDLSERLFAAGVQPYYLHQLDRVQGAAHFDVPVDRGQDIVRQLGSILPGYAVPRYVREVPGQPGKTPIPLAEPCNALPG